MQLTKKKGEMFETVFRNKHLEEHFIEEGCIYIYSIAMKKCVFF